MTSSVPHRLAQLVALGRIGIGCTALAAPTLMTRPWIGDGAADDDARLLARTMGVDPAEARPWVALAGGADAVDAFVTLLAFRRLPRLTRWGILASTVGAAVVSFGVARSLEPSNPPAAPPAAPV